MAGIAQHIQTGVLPSHGHTREIDVCGDVFLAHRHQGVVVGLVQLVAHDGAHVALRVKVLGLGETVIQEKRGSTPPGQQPLGQAGDESLGLGVNFGQVIVLTIDLDGRTPIGDPVLPSECFTSADHPTLVPDALGALQQLHRHGVQHLIAHHHTLDGLGPAVQPSHFARVLQQSVGLSVTQSARQVNDGVPRHRVAQAAQQLQGQGSGACAKFPDFIRACGRQCLFYLHRQGLAKQRRHARRGHKIAARGRHGTEFLQGVGVITQAGFVQGHGHETVKTDPAARLCDGLVDSQGQLGGKWRNLGHPWIILGPSAHGRAQRSGRRCAPDAAHEQGHHKVKVHHR